MRSETSLSLHLDRTHLAGSPCFFCTEWASLGIRHGFLGRPWDFSLSSLEESAQRLCREIGIERLLILDQQHTAVVKRSSDISIVPPKADAATESSYAVIEGAADAIIFDAVPEVSVLIGIRTADCLPVLFRYGNRFAAAHAGWRGLAGGLLPAVADQLLSEAAGEDRSVLDVLIHPHAGFSSYEVGPEVIEAIGADAVFDRSIGGKLLLDLGTTAVRQIRSLCSSEIRFAVSSVDTIIDNGFHSYRRDREKRGSNLAFISIESSPLF